PAPAIDGHLVCHEKVAAGGRPTPPWPSGQRTPPSPGTLRGKGRDGGGATRLCPEEKSLEESGLRQREQSRVHPRRRTEPANDLCLFAVHHAHHRKLPQKFPVAFLDHHAPPVIPSH